MGVTLDSAGILALYVRADLKIQITPFFKAKKQQSKE
jgi:hypothetical protein